MIKNKYVMLIFSMLCATPLLVPYLARAATDGETSIILGAEYTSGDYGTSSKTKIWYFPVTLRYETDANAASVTVSYLNVEGRGDVVVSGGGGGMGMGSQTVQRTSALTGTRTNSGFGDVILTGSHKLSGTASSRIDLTGKIKLGTADETDNLGTGENDYAVQLDFEKDADSNTVYGSAGYKILGDPPGTDYNNVFYGSIGFSHKLDAVLAAGLSLDAQQAALSGGSRQSEITLFLNNKLDKKTKLTGYFLKGIANGSPDWGLGVTLKLIP
jgi:hypothetical protein